MTQDTQIKEDTTQLLVPMSCREMLFQVAHSNPMAGHLGQTATLNRLMTRFFWPGIHENVHRWCASCRECQLVNPPATPKAPLRPLPLMQVPSERIGGDHLSPSQLTDLSKLQAEFADVFSPLPGRTDLIQHHIETEPGVVIRSRPYRLPEHKEKVVQAELGAMLEMGVIEESSSNWASPIVLVPKTDGSVRFCVDYCKVNAVSKFDAYPKPRVDELLDRLGTARFYSTLDLTKGYWHIPLSPLSKEKTAFSTLFGLHQFVTLPFRLFGAPATFQRLMDKILRPHGAYAAAYLDNIIFSND